MNAMAMEYTQTTASTTPPLLTWRTLQANGVAAAVALALHGAVLAVLMMGWTGPSLPVEPPKVLTTQLVFLPPAPPAVPVALEVLPQTTSVEPPSVPVPIEPTPAVAAPIEPPPAKPAVDPQVQARKLEQAALAHKRVEERKQEAEQKRAADNQRQAEQQRQLDLQRQAQEQAEQTRQRAEQSRVAAERAASTRQAQADVSQYQPLKKEAPDYPERALEKGLEGDCTVVYDVSPQGQVEHPQVSGACHPLFMRPSLAAASTFRYKPRMVDGKAVTVTGVKNTFHYRIK